MSGLGWDGMGSLNGLTIRAPNGAKKSCGGHFQSCLHISPFSRWQYYKAGSSLEVEKRQKPKIIFEKKVVCKKVWKKVWKKTKTQNYF